MIRVTEIVGAVRVAVGINVWSVAATASPSNRWSDLAMTYRHLPHGVDGVAIISDKADVARADG